MGESEDRYSSRDPFDDVEGWPYREAPSSPRSREREEALQPTRLGSSETPAQDASPPGLVEPEAEPSAEKLDDDGDDSPLVETRLLDDIEEHLEAEPEDLEPRPELEPGRDELEPEPDHPSGAATPAEELADGAAAAALLDEAVEEPEPEPEHAKGELDIPAGHVVVEGAPNGFRRTVAIVIGRFNGEVTNRLLGSALGALEDAHVAKDSITIVPVPGAFELPLAAMALAKTRRFSCVVALGCVIRGETPHFDFVAGEAASGLQLAAIETGIPVSFGVLTCETLEQAEARVGKGAEAARAALEMADLFSQVRTRAAAAS
jgi:6,7-dimethyl-8-ribityllumazine synthase